MRTCMLLAVLLAGLAIAACVSAPPTATRELLDERSGSTLAIVAEPLVFARQRTDVAAFARDYVTLVAVEANNAGKFTEYLLLYRWSTVDRRMAPLSSPEAGQLVIQAEGRIIDLKPLPGMPVDLSRREELHVPDSADLVTHAYQIDVATLRFIAGSRELSLRLPQESLTTPFELWRDGRAALSEFAQRASGTALR